MTTTDFLAALDTRSNIALPHVDTPIFPDTPGLNQGNKDEEEDTESNDNDGEGGEEV
jgi:hypothetical protein